MRAISLCLLMFFAAGCGVFTKTRPTPKGEWALEAAVGGPLANVGRLPVPVPLSTIGASWGIAEKADLSFHFHPSTLLAFRTWGIDVGSTALLGAQRGGAPAWAITGRGYAFSDFQTGALWFLEATPAVSWRHEKWETFLSTSLLWHGVDGRFSWALGVGETVRLGQWQWGLELRVFDPSQDTTQSIQWVRLGARGAVGFNLGVRYFGR